MTEQPAPYQVPTGTPVRYTFLVQDGPVEGHVTGSTNTRLYVYFPGLDRKGTFTLRKADGQYRLSGMGKYAHTLELLPWQEGEDVTVGQFEDEPWTITHVLGNGWLRLVRGSTSTRLHHTQVSRVGLSPQVDRAAKREQALAEAKRPTPGTLASYAHPAGRVLGKVTLSLPTAVTLAVPRTALGLPDLEVKFNLHKDGTYQNAQGQRLEWPAT